MFMPLHLKINLRYKRRILIVHTNANNIRFAFAKRSSLSRDRQTLKIVAGQFRMLSSMLMSIESPELWETIVNASTGVHTHAIASSIDFMSSGDSVFWKKKGKRVRDLPEWQIK